MMRFFLVSVLTVLSFNLLSINSYAQETPKYIQYMFNTLAFNPAYAGSHKAASITAGYRSQWASIEGAPVSQLLSIHSPVRSEKVGLGFQIDTDKIGVHSSFNASFAYSYRVKLNRKYHLSMGVQGGVTQRRSDYLSLGNNIFDPSISGDLQQTIRPTFASGLYLSSKNFYAGLALQDINNSTEDRLGRVIAHAGYLFDASYALKVQPSTLIAHQMGQPLSIVLNTNFILNDVLWMGISHEIGGAVGALAQIQVTPQLRVGYAYETRITQLPIGGGHEIVLNYRLKYFKSRLVSPRYF